MGCCSYFALALIMHIVMFAGAIFVNIIIILCFVLSATGAIINIVLFTGAIIFIVLFAETINIILMFPGARLASGRRK